MSEPSCLGYFCFLDEACPWFDECVESIDALDEAYSDDEETN